MNDWHAPHVEPLTGPDGVTTEVHASVRNGVQIATGVIEQPPQNV